MIFSKLSEVNPEREKHGKIDDAVGNKKYPESPGHDAGMTPAQNIPNMMINIHNTTLTTIYLNIFNI